MNHAERLKDPRYQRAMTLFETELMPWWKDKIPADPHASEHIRHALGLMATGEDKDRKYLDEMLRWYVGAKYRENLRRDMERQARSSALAE